MSVIEDLVLAFQARGTTETAAGADEVAGAVKRADTAAKGAAVSHTKLGGVFSNIKSQLTGAIGMAGFGGLAFTIGESIKGAEKLQEVQAQLGSAIHANVRAPAKDATKQMTEFADSMSTRGGFAPTDALQGMTQLVRVTHDVSKAQNDMLLSTNIARGAHVDLGRAVRAVTMLEMGRATGLSKLGINVQKVTTAEDALKSSGVKATVQQTEAAKQADLLATKQAAMAMVTKQYSGAMTTYSHTAAGSISNLRNTVEVLSTKLGAVLLPIVTKVAGMFSKFVDQMMRGQGFGGKVVAVLKDVGRELENVFKWVKQNKDWLEFVGAAIFGIVAAIKIAAIVTDAWKTAQLAFDAAADANPYVLVIGAIIAVLVLAYIKFKWFRDFVNDAMKDVVAAFNWVKNAAIDVFDWVKDHWSLLATILLGPVLGPILQIVLHFNDIKQVVTDVVNWIVQEFNRMLNFLEGLPDAVTHLLTHLWDGLLSGLADMPKKVLGMLEKIPVIGSAIKVGGKAVSGLVSGIGAGLSVVGLQSGGTVTQGGAFMVGERGPEVVRLPRGTSVAPANTASGGGMEQGYTFVIYLVMDGQTVSRSVVRQGLLQQSRGA